MGKHRNTCRILGNALIQHPGEGLAEYVKTRRLMAARNLFIGTGLPIAEISEKIGFSVIIISAGFSKKKRASREKIPCAAQGG